MRHDHSNIADEYENKYFKIFNNILNFNLCIDSCFLNIGMSATGLEPATLNS